MRRSSESFLVISASISLTTFWKIFTCQSYYLLLSTVPSIEENFIGHEWNNVWDIDVGGVKWQFGLVECG